MSEETYDLADRIRLHYNELNSIEKYMDIRNSNITDFESISAGAVLNEFRITNDNYLIDDLGRNIAQDMVSKELSHFFTSVKNISCKTVETDLNGLVETLDTSHDSLWDEGFEVEQIFMPMILKREVRKRKNSRDIGIDFSTQSIKPILAKEMGNDTIVFANKHCFGKTYPTSLEKQILVSQNRGIRSIEIDCLIVQHFQIRTMDPMMKIVVTDVEKSEFYK